MTTNPNPPDPRTLAHDICGITQLIGNTEWICIAKVHGDPGGTNPKNHQHYMINRWPNRERTPRE